MIAILFILGFLMFLVLSSCLNGYVLSVLWVLYQQRALKDNITLSWIIYVPHNCKFLNLVE